ncbi:MAG: hypothetical protein FWH20_04210 [Oscillospiraceae bacterium]|nr:hypothetical protein [Oscillospiraceae bacterium]
MTGGRVENLQRTARTEGQYWLSYHYTDRFVLEGTISEVIIDERTGGSGSVYIVLENYQPLAGNLPFDAGDTISVVSRYFGNGFTAYEAEYGYTSVIYQNPYNPDFANSLTVGEKVAVIGRWEPTVLYESVWQLDPVTRKQSPASTKAQWYSPRVERLRQMILKISA